jgi:hypothetical protein
MEVLHGISPTKLQDAASKYTVHGANFGSTERQTDQSLWLFNHIFLGGKGVHQILLLLK